jgi:hypothetical protein
MTQANGFSFEALLISTILGGLVTLAVSWCLRLWQYERERWTTRVDAFCEISTEAAEAGVEYWLEAGQNEKKFVDSKREIKILGYQDKLDGLLATFEDKLPEHDKIEIKRKLGLLRDALSGGAFQTHNVQVDLNRAREVQAKATDLYVYTRHSADINMRILPKKYPHPDA